MYLEESSDLRVVDEFCFLEIDELFDRLELNWEDFRMMADKDGCLPHNATLSSSQRSRCIELRPRNCLPCFIATVRPSRNDFHTGTPGRTRPRFGQQDWPPT